MFAVNKGNLPMVKALLGHPYVRIRVPVSGAGAPGLHALQVACLHGRADIVREVLRHPTITASDCNDALMVAEHSGHSGIVAMIRGDRAVRRIMRDARNAAGI